ncbi:MAG: hypothetical protein MUF54_18390 [Polyangiaceae bacterium]|jgi:hypothetical protein|nr:hypothetical protein [Polyangiaceae bacterium]
MRLPWGRQFTDQTLENAPVEATKLLDAIAEIRANMQEAGMVQTQIEEGLCRARLQSSGWSGGHGAEERAEHASWF